MLTKLAGAGIVVALAATGCDADQDPSSEAPPGSDGTPQAGGGPGAMADGGGGAAGMAGAAGGAGSGSGSGSGAGGGGGAGTAGAAAAGKDGGAGAAGKAGAGGTGGAASGGLGVSGNRFTLDGKQRFLLGASYFSCLYAPDATLASDFAELSQRGFQLVRCWVNWPIHYETWDTESPDNVALVRADGTLAPAALAKLEAVIARAAARGLVVDVTFNQDTPNKTSAAHQAGVAAAAKALAAHDNLLFDLQNESSHYNKEPALFMSPSQARVARDSVKAADADRLVTVSTTSTASLGDSTSTAKLDVAAYHCCRSSGTITDWAAATGPAVKGARAAVGPGIPIYFQEPNRCGTGGQYADCTAGGSELVTAAVEAKKAGAAAWVFHTMAGYDLRDKTWFALLNGAEKDAVGKLGAAVQAAPWGK